MLAATLAAMLPARMELPLRAGVAQLVSIRVGVAMAIRFIAREAGKQNGPFGRAMSARTLRAIIVFSRSVPF